MFVLPVSGGWVDYHFSVIFNKYKTSDRFLAILPAENTKHRYRQLFLVDTGTGSRTQLTTTDESEVTQILEWTGDDMVYYISTLPGQITYQSIYIYKAKCAFVLVPNNWLTTPIIDYCLCQVILECDT